MRILKGIREKLISAIFNTKSAKAREIHKGATPNKPKIGISCDAQEISFEGSRKIKLEEKAMKKKTVVSIADPKKRKLKALSTIFCFVMRQKLIYPLTEPIENLRQNQ